MGLQFPYLFKISLSVQGLTAYATLLPANLKESIIAFCVLSMPTIGGVIWPQISLQRSLGPPYNKK